MTPFSRGLGPGLLYGILAFLCGAVLGPSAPPKGISPTHPDYDQVWARLQDAGIPFMLGGSMAAARWTGQNWLDSFSLGALMNTRGLVELIVLNIGLDLGILSPRIFAMLVLMALVTTFMAGPLVSLVEWLRQREASPMSHPEAAG